MVPHRTTTSTWGLGDVVLWFVAAQVAAVVVGSITLSAAGHTATASVPLWLLVLLQVPLWAGYLLGPVLVTRTKGQGPVRELGAWVRPSDVLPGLVLGVAAQLVAVPLLYRLVVLQVLDGDLSAPARNLAERATDPVGVVLLVLLAGVAAPLAEELFYRGLLLGALLRRLPPAPAVVISALVFGLVHRQGLQLPALVLFGLLAGWLRVRTGRLGMPWAAHVGFNGATLVILLAT